MCRPTSTKLSKKTSTASTVRSKEWWAKSVAKRTASFLEDEVDTIASGCRFMSQVEENENLLRLQRSQITTNKLLGEGAFSEVYSVSVDGVEESGLVMKHLRPALLANRKKFNQAAADLLFETKFLARMNHPNIIRLRGYAADGVSAYNDGSHDSYFVLMEEVEMTLADRIQQWKADEKKSTNHRIAHLQEKTKYAIQIASALEYLHERNLIYRDLKPDNIGISPDGTIKLLDLGLCREIPESDTAEEVFEMSGVGTRRYMAPEVALGKGYNLKADVFGFSMVMYHLFSCQKPFEMYNREMHKQFACMDGIRPVLPSNWPKQLQEIVTTAWDAESSNRPSMANVRQQLEEFAAESSTTKKKTKKHHPAKKFFRMLALRRGRGKKQSKTNEASSRTTVTRFSAISVSA